MSIEKELISRSGAKCELCGSSEELSVLEVTPSDASAQHSIYVCAKCASGINNPDKMDEIHFNCLND
ncbi:MAG: PhnA domain protein, partial [Campylobacterota bacterium]|nr:PhnA domain protein [Campylobacterota bacterium]